MKDIKLTKSLQEASVNRFYQYLLSHSCAIITSFRNDEKTHQDNLLTNKELKAYLLNKGYGVTSITGASIESYNPNLAKEVKEVSYFVVNLKDDESFKAIITKLGEYYNQDSVIIIDKGGQSSYLVSTNKIGYPNYVEIEQIGGFEPKEEIEFMMKSLLEFSNKPFTKDNGVGLLETLKNHSINGKLAISLISKRIDENSISK